MTDLLAAHHDQFARNLALIGMESPGFEFFSNSLENPRRYYHGMQHIADLRLLHSRLFKQAEGMKARESIFVDLAIWWHDLVYDPTNKPGINEWSSAKWFKFYGESQALSRYAYPFRENEAAITVQEVNDIYYTILSTTHGKIPHIRLPWSLYMLDLDLAGIGASWEVFHKNSCNIKKEYMAFGIKESTFVKGRIKFWKTFKDREKIYYNPYNLEYYTNAEILARENIDQELKELEEELTYFNH